jgi:hypothetical protein
MDFKFEFIKPFLLIIPDVKNCCLLVIQSKFSSTDKFSSFFELADK